MNCLYAMPLTSRRARRIKKSKFAWPLGDAEPGGPSKSSSKRGWTWGLKWRTRSSVPVLTSIAEAADAHRFIQDRKNIGKVLLKTT